MKFLSWVNLTYLVSWYQSLIGVDIDKVKDPKLSRNLAAALRMKLRVLNCNGVCHGTMTAWYNNNHAGAAVRRVRLHRPLDQDDEDDRRQRDPEVLGGRRG